MHRISAVQVTIRPHLSDEQQPHDRLMEGAIRSGRRAAAAIGAAPPR
jgi:hypothetical protein